MTENQQPKPAESLRKFYITLAAPALVLFVLLYGLRKFGIGPVEGELLARVGGPAVFIASAVLALAAPIFHRGMFAHGVRGVQAVSIGRYSAYQKKQMALALAASYACLFGLLLEITRFHFLGAFFFALYGLYYYYPSPNRIQREMRMFRVDQGALDG
jgi:hypothetical protein